MKAPGEELLAKFWDTIADKGIAKLFKPWQLRREGKASTEVKCQEIIAIAQAEKYAEQIRKGEMISNSYISLPQIITPKQQNADKIEPHLNVNLLPEIVNTAENAEFLRKEINITKALLHAEKALENDDTPAPDEKIDSDWLFRWRDNVSQISSEELQSLWGNLLAGEIKNPGIYSLRTLEFIRNISQKEAKKIEQLLQFTTSGFIIRNLQDELDKKGLNFAFLLEMQEIGILSGVDALGLSFSIHSQRQDSFQTILTSHEKCLTIRNSDKEKKLSLEIYPITSIGKEILSLGRFSPNYDFLYKAGKFIKILGFDVEIGDYQRIDGDTISIKNIEQIKT